MLRIGLILTPLIALILFRYPAESIESMPRLELLESSSVEYPGPAVKDLHLQLLHKEEGVRKIYQSGREFSIPESLKEWSLSVPYEGQGYFAYQTIGSEIEHRSSSGELFWRRDSSSYPISNPSGTLILLITGDSNRVDVMDRNGILVKGASLSGSLLVDYAFSNPEPDQEGPAAAAIVLFSDGRYYLIDAAGKKLASDSISDDPVFARSVGLSIDGRSFAIHYEQDRKDYLAAYEWKDGAVNLLYRFKLEKNYPYTLPLDCEDGRILFAPPGESLAVDDGDLTLHKKYDPPGDSLYRAQAFVPSGALMQQQNQILVLDREGRYLGHFTMPEASTPGRFLPFEGRKVLFQNLGGAFRLFRYGSESEAP